MKNSSRVFFGLPLAAVLLALSKFHSFASAQQSGEMAWIPPGRFLLGNSAADFASDESPAIMVDSKGFWMDRFEVTNADFSHFVKTTRYVTTAEETPEWNELNKQRTDKGDNEIRGDKLSPGSLVFLSGDSLSGVWKYLPGASWQHPEGPQNVRPLVPRHPVVHVSWYDAHAYCHWIGKKLPNEAEWEIAARGGLVQKRFPWGDELTSKPRSLANTWQGEFPRENTLEDGYEKTAPVGSYPPNAYGLYDMAGNVWEWCEDWYRADIYAELAKKNIKYRSLKGPKSSFDPSEPNAPKRVLRGGSFLCSFLACSGFRVSARMRSTPDSSFEHTGFRCAKGN